MKKMMGGHRTGRCQDIARGTFALATPAGKRERSACMDAAMQNDVPGSEADHRSVPAPTKFGRFAVAAHQQRCPPGPSDSSAGWASRAHRGAGVERRSCGCARALMHGIRRSTVSLILWTTPSRKGPSHSTRMTCPHVVCHLMCDGFVPVDVRHLDLTARGSPGCCFLRREVCECGTIRRGIPMQRCRGDTTVSAWMDQRRGCLHL